MKERPSCGSSVTALERFECRLKNVFRTINQVIEPHIDTPAGGNTICYDQTCKECVCQFDFRKTEKQYPHSQSRKRTSVYPWTSFRPSCKRPRHKDRTCSLITPPHLCEIQSKQCCKYPLHPMVNWVIPEYP